MPGRLQGRVALVFGAGSSGPGWGNGKAAAVLYAREGARVVAVDISQQAADETAGIVADENGDALAFAADVTDADQIASAVRTAQEKFGTIDVLHNNVGITDMAALEDVTEERWRRVMDVNLTSVFLTCRAALPVMRAQKRGAIVNISSLAGAAINRYPYFSYYASKAGLNHFTRAVAVQHARDGIRANVIMPGLMDTPMVQQQIASQYADREAMMRARHAMSPMGRMGDAWDVARAAVFLASDEAAYITGVCLPVDGGLACLAE
ncbi:MAG TPA: SDR family NAD(P)-dependent oxidoreductase [Acetobacteraceae bacterium]|jgi:NAD(P)-dependent dehydrogenase (short-subunit alcohol dehydrogenase family)|nr:SDR family NAD(P)-dependent oxidoreductase [Acetobacteraceae bacterium]